MNGNALGLIETQGLVGLINAIDAMLKAANVELASAIIKLDGGLVSVMVQGDVSSVRAAVEAGAEAAEPDRRAEGRARHPPPGRADRPGVRRRIGTLKILVANLGSTSFKNRLYDLDGALERLLARGAIERDRREHRQDRHQSPRGRAQGLGPGFPRRDLDRSDP